MTITLRPLSHALGAEVGGVDIAAGVGDNMAAEIREAFNRYGVLLFRDQKVTREQHIAFSALFGELDKHPTLPRDRHPDYPELLMVTNAPKANGQPNDAKYTGQTWHSDMSYTATPAMGSLLRSVKVPSVGGDTMFANMYLAYETLSPGMKRMLEGVHGIHATARKVADPNSDRAAEGRRLNPPIAQPVVRVHPETGRKALYIGEKVTCLVDMTEAESKPIIDHLVRHATRPHFCYRHVWRDDDILMWDNRSTMHLALGDYPEGELRHMERTTILGTPSGYYLN